MQVCLLIPHYDHLDQFRKILPALVAEGIPVVVVDDASPDHVFKLLEQLLTQQAPGSTLVRHAKNLGKGAAVMTGLDTALRAGFTHALQIDADGQHDMSGISELMAMAAKHPDKIICGQPIFDQSISRLRYCARYLTLYLVWLETLSTEIRDALCGFRLYPLRQVVAIAHCSRPGKRMAFDPEILVRAIWVGISLRYVPVKIAYPEDGKSHFHYLRDNLEITWMHIRLVAGMLIRIPGLLRQQRAQKSGPAS